MVGLARASERRTGEFQPYRFFTRNSFINNKQVPMSEKKFRALLHDFIRQVEAQFKPGLNPALLYFAIGGFILDNKSRRDYNREMLFRLFRGLQQHFKEKRRMTMPNLSQMTRVAAAYRKIDSPVPVQSLQWLTWEHHVCLVNKVGEVPALLFYLELARDANMNCGEMTRWIEFGLYERFARRQWSQMPHAGVSLSPKYPAR